MLEIKNKLAKVLSEILKVEINPEDFTEPPKNVEADLALPCFTLAKELRRDPNEIAGELGAMVNAKNLVIIEKVKSLGPYMNFFIDSEYLAQAVLYSQLTNEPINQLTKIMVEFAHPNTHKAFHIGHLRNIITGESIVRILQNAGYKVTRANYQGDVGLHIAKALWGIDQLRNEYKEVKKKDLDDKVGFLGKAYALGGQTFEKDEKAKQEIYKLNEKIYNKEKSIQDVYKTTRAWSLEYFDKVYKRVDSHFDRLYFESEVFEKGKQIVLKFLEKGVFKRSEGAVIFEGEKYGLHSRVFVNSLDFPTYEAKDLALAEAQFKEFKPDRIIHVVGKEQTEYFKVVFKALEFTLPKSKGREEHLAYGWVSLKSGKMSSRTGQVILGEWLLDEIEKRIAAIMKDSPAKDKDLIIKKVALAAVKYAMLKIGVKVDMAFDIEESVNTSGDSGPYLLYIVARIKSILKKVKGKSEKHALSMVEGLKGIESIKINEYEKSLLLKVAKFEEAQELAAKELDPSQIAKYLFELAQEFNGFYHECPVLQAEQAIQAFRINLIKKVEQTMTKGLNLLGIEPVDEM